MPPKFVVGNVEAMPFKRGVFDSVMGVTTLCFVSDPENVIIEMARVLKPGGIFWVNSPNYSRGDLANNWCAAKTTGMPKWLQESVLLRLNDKYGK